MFTTFHLATSICIFENLQNVEFVWVLDLKYVVDYYSAWHNTKLFQTLLLRHDIVWRCLCGKCHILSTIVSILFYIVCMSYNVHAPICFISNDEMVINNNALQADKQCISTIMCTFFPVPQSRWHLVLMWIIVFAAINNIVLKTKLTSDILFYFLLAWNEQL